MAKPLKEVLVELKDSLSTFYPGQKGDRYIKQVDQILKVYSGIDVQERHQETYDSLCKRGVELLKPGNLKDEDKLKYFLRYCGAATYDFKDHIEPLNWIIRSFMVTVMFFYIIAPQYFSYVLPLVMVVPVFVGIRGMKKRSLNGLITGGAMSPLALMVGTLHFKNILLALDQGYMEYIAQQAESFGLSIAFTEGLMTTMNVGAAIMMASAAFLGYMGIRHHKMFI